MNLDQANAQAVLLDESVIYRLPELNAEDALVFFGRDPNDQNVPDGYGRLLRLARGAQKLETIGRSADFAQRPAAGHPADRCWWRFRVA